MPLFTVLRSAAQHRLRVHASHLEPGEHTDRETRRHVDVEPTVAIEVRRVRAVLLQPLLVSQEQWDARSVLAVVEGLDRLVVRRVEPELRGFEDTRRTDGEVVAEDRGGIQKRRERVEHLGVVRLSGHLHDRTQRWERHVPGRFAVEREQAELRVGVVEIANDESVVHDLRAFDHVGRLRNDLAPRGPLGVARIHRDDAPPRGRVVGLEVEGRSGIPHESIRRIEIVEQEHEQTDDGRVEPRVPGVAQVLVIDAIAPIGAEPDGVDRIAPLGAHFDAEAPVGMIGPLVDQPVGGLIGAQFVVIDLLVVIDFEQRIGTGGRLRIATVEEAGAIVRPGGARELDPLQVIGAVLPRRHVADAEFLPVGAAPRRSVHHRPAVLCEREDRERNGPVGRERVRIEQDVRFGRQRALRVEHRLVLQS